MVTPAVEGAFWTVRMIVGLAACIVFGILLFLLWRAWGDYQRLLTFEQQALASDTATTATVAEVTEKVEEKQKVEFIITDRRAASDRRFEEVKREDQTAAEWAATPIPDSVRNIDASQTDGTPGIGVGSEGADRASRSRGSNKESR
jgi:hypothetical protein